MNTYIIETENSLQEIIKESVAKVVNEKLISTIKELLLEYRNCSNNDEYINIKEACEILNKSYPTIRKLIDNGELQAHKSQESRNYFIKKSDIFKLNSNNNLKLIKRA